MIITDFSRLRIESFLLFIFLVIHINVPSVVFSEMPCEVKIYSFIESGNSEKLMSYFNNKSNCVVAYYDLNNGNNLVEFLKIAHTLAEQNNIQVVPPEVCTHCLLYYYTLDEIYQMYAVPIVIFFRDGRLTAITIATTEYEILDQALTKAENVVRIFVMRKIYTLVDEDISIQLKRVVRKEETATFHVSFLPLIITALAVGIYILSLINKLKNRHSTNYLPNSFDIIEKSFDYRNAQLDH